MVWVLGLTSRSDLLALFFIFGVLNLTNLDEKGGGTTTPPLLSRVPKLIKNRLLNLLYQGI